MKINISKSHWKIIIIILIVIAIIYIYFNYFSSKQLIPPVKKVDSTNNTNTTSDNNSSSISFPLKYGSTSSYIKNLQLILNNNYGLSLTADGNWGPSTDAAIKSHFNISSNGTISESDYNNILSSEGSNSTASSSSTGSSFSDWLTNLLG